MTLEQWLENRWLKHHATTAEEIRRLMTIVERDLRDARADVSPDWRFGIAYNAALKLCTIALFAAGYKPERTLHHYRTIQALPKVLGPTKNADAAYLDACRAKRNMAEYDTVGAASGQEADELIQFVEELKEDIVAFVEKHHPHLISLDRK